MPTTSRATGLFAGFGFLGFGLAIFPVFCRCPACISILAIKPQAFKFLQLDYFLPQYKAGINDSKPQNVVV
jgi:hypothetical protein